jgi:hypothetical protein
VVDGLGALGGLGSRGGLGGGAEGLGGSAAGGCMGFRWILGRGEEGKNRPVESNVPGRVNTLSWDVKTTVALMFGVIAYKNAWERSGG